MARGPMRIALKEIQFFGATKIDGFGNYLRWGFTLSAADGTPILSGIDFAIIENGKLQLVMGFFDFAPNPINVKAPEPKQ
jgi:hypothetical protein